MTNSIINIEPAEQPPLLTAPRHPGCGTDLEPVFLAQEGFRVNAWYCPVCGAGAPAIGRERLITKDLWEGHEDG